MERYLFKIVCDKRGWIGVVLSNVVTAGVSQELYRFTDDRTNKLGYFRVTAHLMQWVSEQLCREDISKTG